MPKKKAKDSPKDQLARFKAEVQRLVAAGELNPTEADERFEKALKAVISPDRKKSNS